MEATTILTRGDTRARYAAITVIALCASGTPSEQVMQWIQVIKVLFH